MFVALLRDQSLYCNKKICFQNTTSKKNEKVDKSMEEKHIKIKIYHTSEINF